MGDISYWNPSEPVENAKLKVMGRSSIPSANGIIPQVVNLVLIILWVQNWQLRMLQINLHKSKVASLDNIGQRGRWVKITKLHNVYPELD